MDQNEFSYWENTWKLKYKIYIRKVQYTESTNVKVEYKLKHRTIKKKRKWRTRYRWSNKMDQNEFSYWENTWKLKFDIDNRKVLYIKSTNIKVECKLRHREI